MSCPACGDGVPDGARFCPSCGHGVKVGGDERRMATVLFADLAGFTGLSETLDPEQVKNLVDSCFARLAVDVTSHGGRVDKVIGDAIVALFGAPVAHEDDAERAVRAGLQMQRTIAALASELGVALRLRVGVNSGEVLVGAMQAGGGYTAMGDTVNVASRLQTMAAPGAVVVGPATYAATAPVVRYDRMGELQARGREAPVPAWRAIESLSVPGRRPRRNHVPLTGRDDELTILRQSVATSIRRSRPSVTFLVGEAGMGKSRLIEEVAGWAADEYGALVLEGRCVPYGEANPWWPIAEAVRTACGVEIGDTSDATSAKVAAAVARVCGDQVDAGDAAGLAAGLLYLMGDEDALPDVDPQRARREARRALHALISGLTRRQPVVLVLSELHWADDVVLDLFGWDLDRMAGRPLAVLTTSRFELIERWSPPHGRFNLLTLHLDPLDARATRELAEALGAGALPDEVREELVQRSGGNPFFLEELLTYVGEGRLGELPVTLRGLVAARIDALPPEERSVLEDAAVIGRSGSGRILAALSGSRGLSDVERVVATLASKDLLAVGEDRWEFRSDVVREVAYGTLTKAERAGRHWRVGSWLAEAGRRTGRTDELLELVAHHYATAAEVVQELGSVPSVPPDAADLALAVLERAAGWASRRELPMPAIRLLDRGVALAPAGSRARRRLLLDRAMERATLRELRAARDDLDATDIDGAETGGDTPVDDAAAAPGDAAGAAPGDAADGAPGDRELRARHLTVEGVVLQLEGDLAGSAATLRRAVEAWRAAGDRAGEGDALRRFGMTAMLATDAPAAEAALHEALAIARDLGSRRDEAWALWHLAELSFYAGKTEEAEGRLHDAGQAFLEAGDSGGLGWVRGLLGYLKMVQGHRDEAEQLALGVLEDLRDRGDRWALGMVLVLLGSVRLWQGRATAAAGHAAEARVAFGEIEDVDGELRAAGCEARALAALGRADEAWDLIREVIANRAGSSLGLPEFGVAGVASHLGDGRAVLDMVVGAQVDAFAEEAAVTRGVALLQTGRTPEGLDVLESLCASMTGAAGAAAGGWAALALARSCAGDSAGAAEAAARVVAVGDVATYRDAALARLAAAFAHHQMGDRMAAQREIEAARAAVVTTEDVVTGGVVELASARIDESAGRPGGDELVSAALDRLERFGASAVGWDTAVSAAVKGLAAAT
jgi:class 3 adenylate cyclase/tetratricopeptide (TPR) repeat protein